jgi:uncharacterized protein YjiS (DUF1127 family)
MGMFSDLMTWVQRSRLRQRLLRMDERRLDDIGYSRALLEDGMRAWPWRLPVDSIAGLGRFELDPFRGPSHAKAVAELQAYSDAELSDLGLSRGTIEHAVRNGRPGYPEEQRQAA